MGSVAFGSAWRVYVQQGPDASSALVANPLTSLEEALDRLLLIGTVAGVVLVVVLGAGAWVVLGPGLRPLERMAVTATASRGEWFPASGGELAWLVARTGAWVIVVTGAIGTIGAELVQLLSRAGASARALSRHPADVPQLDGVEWVRADLADPATLAEPMSDADHLFLLTGNTADMVEL